MVSCLDNLHLYWHDMFLEVVRSQNHYELIVLWVKQCHLHHPPVITIFIGGVNHSQSWVVYDIALLTLTKKLGD